MNKFKAYFPLTDKYTYLNTAASGLLPKPVLEFRQQHDMDFYTKGGMLKELQGEHLAEVREKVGHLFSCMSNRVALVPNFSYGFNTLLEGMSTPQKVLLLEQDYPSVNWPFKTRNFNITYVSINTQLEDQIEAAFAKAQPDIFAFSIVQYISGIKIDLSFVKDLKSRYPETLFIADGTQYFGTEVFDFDSSGLDVIGGSTYKWMNAGYGNAFFLFKPDVVDKVAPKTTGFNSLQGKYKPQEGNFIGRFEPGHQDTLNYGSLGAAIDLINTYGMAAIASRIQEISNKAKEAFAQRGLLASDIFNRKQHASIYSIKGDETLIHRLREEGVICVERGGRVRVSFHYFNTEDDIKKLMRVLD